MYKNLLILLLAIFCIPVFLHSQGEWRQGEGRQGEGRQGDLEIKEIKEIKVFFNNKEQADHLNQLNLNGDIYLKSGYALFYVTPDELAMITSAGFRCEILKNDLREFAKNFWSQRDQYHSYDEIIDVIDSLSTLYPSICKKYSYGLSVEGRQLCALKISDNVNTDEPEPEIMFDGGIHGDEVGGPENLVRFAEFLCDSYNSDPEITNLINTREIWLYIMVNPDGRVNMVRQNSQGVDLNRDWGYMWNGTGSSPDYYSQPETRALRNCSFSNQFVIHTTYHSGVVFLAYPWSYRPDSCPDKPHIHHLAGVYVSSSGYSYLPYEQGYTGMYAISGSSKDANYGVMGSVAWTMELSTNKQPPASQIQYYYVINEPAMIAMIEHAGYGIGGTVSDAETGFPVAATIFIDDFYPCYNDPVIGDYHKYLLPGNYTVKAVANGYQTMTQTVTVTENQQTTLDFSLAPEYSHFAYRTPACRIPTANFYDEARTCAALGEPDYQNYSLGRSGWIILDMQSDIPDGPGNEITVHEGDSDPEGYACYVATSLDGPWHLAGNGTGTASFDLAASGLTTARYIRIIDDGDGPVSGDNAGFDLDAVEVPLQPQVIYLLVDCHIDDIQGNQNHRIDPGEVFNLVVTIRNAGNMMMENGQAYLNIDPQHISVSNPAQEIENLEYGDVAHLVFNMNCSFFCPKEEILMTIVNITSNEGMFQQSYPLNFTAGAILEDWETVGFNKFDWSTGGNKPWAISFLDPYAGNCSAKSGNIDDGQSTWLQITMDVIGYDDISFYRKISSESGSDHLKFYIDNNLMGEWSGESGWELASFQVLPGYHTFKWSYVKDNMNSAGADGAWIDDILFPSCNLDGTLKALANAVPHEFCGAVTSQLGAYAVGGSGMYNYQWEPAELLDDPAIQFPVAEVGDITVFSVEVNDGSNTITSDVRVDAYPLPATPVIMQQGDSLISSSADGNQWHDFSGPIAGATGQVFYPQVENNYFVIITSDEGCISDSSNVIYFLFTSIEDQPDPYGISIYPNPFNETLTVQIDQLPGVTVKIRFCDVFGRNEIEKDFSCTGLQSVIHISTAALKNCLYLLIISDVEGKVLYSRKIIKF